MATESQAPDHRSEAKSVLDELRQHAQARRLLPERFVKTLLVLAPLEKPALEKGKVYYVSEPIAGKDEQRELAPAASQLIEYLGFKNAKSDPPGTPAAHLFFTRLLQEPLLFRLTTIQFRQLCELRSIFLVTGRAARTEAAPAAAPKVSDDNSAAATEVSHVARLLSSQEDPGFSTVIQALGATTLQFQTDDRVSFQNIITDLLQAQRVYNTLRDIQQSLGIVQVALSSFDSKVNQWEYRFTDFFQRNRPETVGMTTINNLKAQQNKGRGHLASTKYQFGKLLANLEQAKIYLEQQS